MNSVAYCFPQELIEMHENDDPWLAARGIDMFEQFDLYMEETVHFL